LRWTRNFFKRSDFYYWISVRNEFIRSKTKKATAGGASMYPSKNIVENAINSKDRTTLVSAVKVADLVENYKVKNHSPFLRQHMQRLTN
jgi:uncharacterized surface protein with fasciclin (FAS1) repeats